ncbi:MAG: VWA domain-containing protein [Clostridia bacterium]|nr:VWA domain-containing protein [Clostridia bacterium]
MANRKNEIKKEAPKATELVLILDRSGSMSGMESDTIGGFNGMIRRQKGEEGEAFVTTVLFDDEMTTLHDRLPISKVGDMTEKEYRVGGCTALLDAIGKTVEHISSVHRYVRPEDVPGKTLVVITTDGMENASRNYSPEAVRKLVEKKQEEGWEFLFLGANIDAITTARTFGIREDRAATYRCDKAGTRKNFKAVSEVMCCLRKGSEICEDWKEEIVEYEESGRKS